MIDRRRPPLARTLAGLVLGSSLLASHAAAQETPSAVTPTDTTPPGETPVVATDAPSTTTEEDVPVDPDAMRRFELATARMDAGDHGAALTEFEAVYALLEGHPRRYFVLYNLGLCQRALFQTERAIRSFRAYLEALPPGSDERPEVERAIAELEAQLATLTVRSAVVDARVWIDDRELGPANTSLSIPSGHHTIEVRSAGRETARREVALASGQSLSMEVDLATVGNLRGLDPVWFTIGAIATGAALVGGGVLGSMALVQRADVDACLASESCRFSRGFEGDARTIGDLALAADVLFATAALAGVTSVVLAFVTDFSGGSSAVALHVGPSSLALMGSF